MSAGVQKSIARVARHPYDPVGAVQRIFDEAGGLMRQSHCSGGCFFGNLAQEASDGNERIRKKVAEHLQAWTTELAAFLERWRRDGYFREGFQPQAAAQAILSLLEGALLLQDERWRRVRRVVDAQLGERGIAGGRGAATLRRRRTRRGHARAAARGDNRGDGDQGSGSET